MLKLVLIIWIGWRFSTTIVLRLPLENVVDTASFDYFDRRFLQSGLSFLDEERDVDCDKILLLCFFWSYRDLLGLRERWIVDGL